MSDWHVEVCLLTDVRKHPNADTLSVGEANGCPVVFRTGDYAEGEAVVHIPIDSIVPDTEEWAFLGSSKRIKAKKLRGVFSMGLLAKAQPEWALGQNVQAELCITKHDPDLARERGPRQGPLNAEKDPGICPKYDIEGLRKYKDLFQKNEEVWISEKIHGQNARFVWFDGKFWCASRNFFKKESDDDTWWRVARRYDLAKKLQSVPGLAIYGETYGNNSDMPYGVMRGHEADRFVMFDAYYVPNGRWANVDEMLSLANELDIPVVPTLYRGPWKPELAEMAEGPTVLGSGNHVREGIVVKPIKERWDTRIGRVFLKLAGQGYLLRKAA